MDGFKKWNHLPHVKPHWFWGNRPVFSKCLRDIILDHYNALGENKFGLYWYLNEATIFLKDKDLIKRVQVVDFDHFTDLAFSPDGVNQFGLADVKGEPWKKMKRQLTPSFSVPRLKKNVETMNEVANQLTGYLQSIENREYVEVIDFTKKYFLNVIASVGFGLRIDCFGEKKSAFEKAAETVFDDKGYLILELFPRVAKIFGISLVSKSFDKYLQKLCKELIKQRENQNNNHKDILNNLIEVSKINPDMTEEILYKTFVQMFGDGYESASAVFGYLVYQLVINPDVQAQLQEEIDFVFDGKEDGEDLSADDLTNMPYLEQVLSEATRLACLAYTVRYCSKDYKIPDSDFVIPKGTKVFIPIAGLHYDPKYWTNPFVFDPERFSSENKSSIDSITFQTFGSGPRQCLGMNLYLVEAKVQLVHLLRKFRLKPYGDMPTEIRWDVGAFIGQAEYKIRLESRDI